MMERKYVYLIFDSKGEVYGAFSTRKKFARAIYEMSEINVPEDADIDEFNDALIPYYAEIHPLDISG